MAALPPLISRAMIVMGLRQVVISPFRTLSNVAG